MKHIQLTMHRLCSLLFISLFASLSYSQAFDVSGKIVDQDGKPISFANVLLLSAKDSTFIKGTSASEEGVFMFEEVEPALYFLKASYINNQSSLLGIDVKESVQIGALIIPLNVEELNEVVVAAQKPTVKRLADRIVFNVENTVVSQGSTLDILKSTPGVIENQGGFLIRGQKATIYLNNRKVQLSNDEVNDLLKGFAGVNIKSVEVMATPPASYDAESGSIINIITSKSVLPGYKGSINGTYTQAVFPKYSVGTSHYFKTDKLNLFANYSYNPKKEIRKTKKGINFINDANQVFSIWDTDLEELKRAKSHNATVIVDYKLDDKNSLNFTSYYLNNPNETNNGNSVTTILNNQKTIDSTFRTINQLERDNTNFAADLTFTHRFKKDGAKLDVNTHYTNYSENFQQALNSNYFDASTNGVRSFGFDTSSKQDIEIFIGQLDITTPIGNGSLDAGLKASVINSESNIDYFNFSGSDESISPNLSDNFLYDENIYAAYASIVKDWDKWSLKAGIRGEYTDAKGTSLNLGLANDQNFFELFPSLYILHTLNEKNSLAFDYNRGLDRPRYNDLNPFRNFVNENDFEEGNAGLTASFTQNFNLNYTYNDEWFFDLYYRDNGQLIEYLIFQDNENLTLRELKQNVLESISYGFDITFSKGIIDPWYLYAYISIFHEHLDVIAVESNNAIQRSRVDGLYAYWANYLTLSKDGTFTGELGFSYMSNFIFGTYIQDEQINLSLGLRKSLWNNRAAFSLTIEDILEEYVPTYTSKYLNQDNYYKRRPETQFVRFGFTYNFGNFRLSDNQRAISKRERERLKSE